MLLFKSIISPMQNCDEIASRFCMKLKVQVTETSLKKEVTEHPNYPSMLSISDALSTYKVASMSLKTTVDNLDSFPTPFIAQVNGLISQYNLFAIVNMVMPNSINWFNPEKKKNEQISREDFDKVFSGYVLLAEADEFSGEREYKQKKKEELLQNFWKIVIALALPAFILVLIGYIIVSIGFINSIFSISYAIVTLIGAITGALLLLYEVDQHNPTLQKVCHGGAKTNCESILNSKASRIWGISWSTIGFTFFCGILLANMATGLVNIHMLSIIAYLNLLALPYVFFSIFYQAYVVRQWCPMCLTVQAMLVLQFIIAVLGNFFIVPTSESILPFFIISICFLSVFISAQLLIPSLRKSKESKFIQNELVRLKHNPEVFKALLEMQKKISEPTTGLGITIGNLDSQIKLIKVCNPYCGPCANAHPIIEELLENNSNLQLQIIFTASDEVNDESTPPVQHLLAIANKGDALLIKKAIDDWYLSPSRDYNNFAQKHPINEDLKLQLPNIRAMHRWTELENIKYTPTFFINGHQLPENYHVSDLKHFLSI